MKILEDQNISFRLLSLTKSKFPDIAHVRELGLTDFNDFKIFQYARQNHFAATITLDEDFYNNQLEHGIPPKVIWLRTGNCSTPKLAEVIMQNVELVERFRSMSSMTA